MKTLLRFTLAICSFSLLAGCGDQIDHSKIRQSGFVYCGHGSPTTFNPQLVDNGITSEALSPQLYDTLLQLDADTLQPLPNLATSWSVNKAGTEYTFNLRSGVYFQTTAWFSPTRELNADDVTFSFRRIIDSTNPFHYVNGGTYPWFAGIDFKNLLIDVQAIDDLTVKFILSRPDNSFLSNISTSHAVILSYEYANQLIIDDEKALIDSLPVGTGPFYLDEFKVNDLIRLRRNGRYWNGPAKMEQVVFDISNRGTGTLAKLLRHECDVLSSPISSQIPIVEQQPELTLQAKPAMNVAFIAVNTSHPALHNANVRKALNFAINRQNILDSVYYGTGSIAYNLLPPSSWAYQKDSIQIRYDRNYAIALLKEAGYYGNLELTMSVPTEPRAYNPSPRKTAELIQANFADIGIKLNLLTEDRLNRSDMVQNENVDLFLTGWIGDTGDPDNFLRPLLSCNSNRAGLNVAMWCNNDFDFLLDLALEVDKTRYRLNLYKQAQNILNEEFPVIPLAHGMQFKAYNSNLTGFKLSPFNVQPFNRVERVK
ncbi:peptide ABC transporter substrate-binding protein SapA [Vibrio aestuarianus]|uniref:Peptide ABC transporter substrate-binding protein SapA n=1 Tax=Vibrio aestuarianus TaxID=28171 RepID=A0A9X4FJD6_9VIBR|nr:ABC transporter substrate-binding protein SapA [Vibrio aestuarianus]MDE1234878.1 peptide ABC transporter substrate-binding protein SapA [Vibrio aestuarianus]MDE1245759.1 peptide ABC transporter substrate-binding protein SapA [Vibrio aestuarianus]MDE1263193.1 peptide ABC transporter substrate-binding protein SapA [Vibrio aestuarianus]MDE1297136.1 peptide ABC transporter substrate-binding protein SapA [Vibrio aestuarianus]MDE1332091.1 peptide ABC transporter substrate-binding protein SapA [Vi